MTSGNEAYLVDYESDSSSLAPTPRLSKRQRLRNLKSSAKHTTKHLLNVPSTSRHPSKESLDEGGDGTAPTNITENAAFNTRRVFHKDEEENGNIVTKATQKLHGAARAVAHPRDAAKKAAAGRLTVRENSYLKPEADAELLSAQEDLEDAVASADGTIEDETHKNLSRKRVADLEEDRDTMRAAWVTGRHVKRVKAMRRNTVPYPQRHQYWTAASNDNKPRFRWESYLGHMLLYISQDFTSRYIDDRDEVYFQRDALIRQAERFLIATDGWQSWIMRVRHIYLWEDPWLTFRWLIWYMFLIKTNYVMTFCYGWVVYIVVLNKMRPQSIKLLRDSHERAMDGGSRAHKISELARRHGNNAWLDPLIDEFGPLVQRQLGDATDYLEILINFYDWRSPWTTLYAVILYSMVFVICACTSTDFSLRYRHVVANLRWIYWNIPTHPELAFEQLRAQAQQTLDAIRDQTVQDQKTADSFPLPSKRELSRQASTIEIEPPSSDSSSDASSIQSFHSAAAQQENLATNAIDTLHERPVISFKGHSHFHDGLLVLTSVGMRFERRRKVRKHLTSEPATTPREVLWSRSYIDLLELQKTKTEKPNGSNSISATPSTPSPASPDSKTTPLNMTKLKSNLSVLTSHTKKNLQLLPPEALAIEFSDNTTETIEGMSRRDEAFNSIIGFSGATWMNLPPLAAVHGHRDDGKRASVLNESLSNESR
ncbi:MAG: hypothetical protein M1828_007089 [Chrysothrix sp. TS-e1954]|nr:MAG: hypothetical protein M1828_007089 [Chrysothrix sp. TS-e1954]